MTQVQQGNASNAFTKGMEIVKATQTDELNKQCREELCKGLGITTRAALNRRARGFVNHTKAERAFIEQVFKKYGAPNCWDA